MYTASTDSFTCGHFTMKITKREQGELNITDYVQEGDILRIYFSGISSTIFTNVPFRDFVLSETLFTRYFVI